MRQTSIPKAIVDALNEQFDANPTGVSALLGAHTQPIESGELGERTRPANALDILNAVLDSVAPGKRLVTMIGPGGLEGFALARDRKPTTDPGDPVVG